MACAEKKNCGQTNVNRALCWRDMTRDMKGKWGSVWQVEETTVQQREQFANKLKKKKLKKKKLKKKLKKIKKKRKKK